MKKISMILSALMLLMCGLMFTGCDEEDSLLGPLDTWCTLPLTATIEGNETVVGYLALVYSESGLSNASNSEGSLKSAISVQPGLTMVAWKTYDGSGDTASVLKALTSNQYVIKTFPKSETTTVNDGDDSSDSVIIKASRTKWTALYLAKGALRNSENQKKHPAAPTPIANGGSWTELTDLSNFSWKNILKSYLINLL